jgi:hypothetical protein
MRGWPIEPKLGKRLFCLCLAKIKSACEINNIQRHRVTCYMDENRLVRSFGEGQLLILARDT